MLYYPIFNQHTNSKLGTILFLQICYWFNIQQKPFFKFDKPCPHLMCRPDDTWLKELDLTYSELNGIRKRTGSFLKKGESYNIMELGVFLCWKQSSNVPMYAPNLALIDLMGEEERNILKKYFPYLLNWEKQFVNSEIPSCEIDFSKWTISKFLVPYQYTTQEINQLKKQENNQKGTSFNFSSKSENPKEKSSAKKEKKKIIILPFDTDTFSQLWQSWKDYLLGKCHYTYSSKEEQELLILLSDYDEEFATRIINKAIQKKWKNFHFPSTPSLFKQKNNTHEHTTFKNTADPVAEQVLRDLS